MSGFKGSQLWMPAELLMLTDNSLQMSVLFEAKGSPSSDIFATGCVTFYYVTRGIHPFGSGAIEVPKNIRKNKPVNIEQGLYLNTFSLPFKQNWFYSFTEMI